MANRLPGMEDAQIESLETLAESYKKVQKRRLKALAEEVKLKDELMTEMKANKKRHYKYGGLEIEIVTTKEKVRVKTAKEDEEEESE